MSTELAAHRPRHSDATDRTVAVPAVPDAFPLARTGLGLLASVALLLAGLNIQLPKGLTLTVVIGVLLAPVWLVALRRYAGLGAMLGVGLLATVSGVALSTVSRADHVVVSANTVFAVAHLWSGLVTLGLLVWARTVISIERVAISYALGSLANGIFLAGVHSLSWKYAIGTPIAIIVLAVVDRRARTGLTVLAGLTLGVLGALNEARSYLGFCLLAATLVFWQRRSSIAGRVGQWAPAVLLAGVATTVYFAGSALLTGGYLGATLQARSVAQIDSAGSLIAGGRPEWFGTWQLMHLRPMGYGTGVTPSWLDVQAAERGLVQVGLQPDNGYVLNYMFGGQFRLHSILADLWVSYGWTGFALGLLAGYLLIRNLSRALAQGAAPAVTIFAVSLAVWTLAFGPIFSNWPDVCFALGLCLAARPALSPTR